MQDNQFSISCFPLLSLAFDIAKKLNKQATILSTDKTKTTIIFPPKRERKKKKRICFSFSQ